MRSLAQFARKDFTFIVVDTMEEQLEHVIPASEEKTYYVGWVE